MLLLSIYGFSQEEEMHETYISETQEKKLSKWNFLLKDKAVFKDGGDALLNFYKAKSKHEILNFEIVDITIFYTLTIDKNGKPLDVRITQSPSEKHTKELKRREYNAKLETS